MWAHTPCNLLKYRCQRYNLEFLVCRQQEAYSSYTNQHQSVYLIFHDVISKITLCTFTVCQKLQHHPPTNSHLSCSLFSNQIFKWFIGGCVIEGEEQRCCQTRESLNMCLKEPLAYFQLQSYQGADLGYPAQQDTTDTCHHPGLRRWRWRWCKSYQHCTMGHIYVIKKVNQTLYKWGRINLSSCLYNTSTANCFWHDVCLQRSSWDAVWEWGRQAALTLCWDLKCPKHGGEEEEEVN